MNISREDHEAYEEVVQQIMQGDVYALADVERMIARWAELRPSLEKLALLGDNGFAVRSIKPGFEVRLVAVGVPHGWDDGGDERAIGAVMNDYSTVYRRGVEIAKMLTQQYAQSDPIARTPQFEVDVSESRQRAMLMCYWGDLHNTSMYADKIYTWGEFMAATPQQFIGDGRALVNETLVIGRKILGLDA